MIRHFIPNPYVQRGSCYEGMLAAFAHFAVSTEEFTYFKGVLDLWHVGVVPNHNNQKHKSLAGLGASGVVRKINFQTVYFETEENEDMF